MILFELIEGIDPFWRLFCNMWERKIELVKIIIDDPSRINPWFDLHTILVSYPDENTEFRQTASALCDTRELRPLLNCFDGILFQIQGDEETSLNYYKKAVTENESLAYAWFSLGTLLERFRNRYIEAEQAFRKAIDLDDKAAQPWCGLGCLLRNYPNRYVEAEQACRKAIDLDDRAVYSWHGLGVVLSYNRNRHDEAEQAYRKAIDLDDKVASLWNDLGILLIDYFSRHVEAEQAFKKAIALNDKIAEPWYGLGILLNNYPNRYDEAEQAFKKAIDLKYKAVQPWCGLGLLLSDHPRRHVEAEQAFKKAIDLDKTYADSWNGLGLLLGKYPSRHQEAENALLQAIFLKPNQLNFFIDYCAFLTEQGDTRFGHIYLESLPNSLNYREDTLDFQTSLIHNSSFLNSSIQLSENPFFIYAMSRLLSQHGALNLQTLNLKIPNHHISNALLVSFYLEHANENTFLGLLYLLGGWPTKALHYLDEFETIEQGNDFFYQYYLHQAHLRTYPLFNNQEILHGNIPSLIESSINSDVIQAYYFTHFCLLAAELQPSRGEYFLLLVEKQLNQLRRENKWNVNLQFVYMLSELKSGNCNITLLNDFVDGCQRFVDEARVLKVIIDKESKIEKSNLMHYLFLQELEVGISDFHTYLMNSEQTQVVAHVKDNLLALTEKLQETVIWENLELSELAIIQLSIWEKQQMQVWRDKIREIILNSNLKVAIFDHENQFSFKKDITKYTLADRLELFIQNEKGKILAQQVSFWLTVNEVITVEDYCLLSVYCNICYLRTGRINDVADMASNVISTLLPTAISGIEAITNYSVHKAGFGLENFFYNYADILQKTLNKLLPVDENIKGMTIKDLEQKYLEEKSNFDIIKNQFG
jgi:Flp pilus assembly protein TadD/predicted house-cleaning noncanonical NTP pyrophosphatase (MazG superfamily)